MATDLLAPPDDLLASAGPRDLLAEVPVTPEARLGERKVLQREQRIGSMEAQLGAPLAQEPNVTASFPPTRMQEFTLPNRGARFDIARSLTPQGEAEKIMDKFPELEVQLIDDPEGGQVVAIRQPGAGEFALLDSEDVFTLGDAIELGGDLVSMETLGTIISTIASRGSGLIKRMGSQFLGGGGGRAADVAIEQAREFEQFSLRRLIEDPVLSGALAAGAEGLFSPVRRLGEAITGRGAVRLTPEERAAEVTAREGNVGGLSLGRVMPIAERIENQAAASSKAVQVQRRTDLKNLRQDMIDRQAEFGDLGSLTDAQFDDLIQQMEADITGMLKVGPVDPALGGKALQDGRKEFVKVYKAQLDRLYTRAIAAYDGLQLDVTEAVSLAKSFKSGIRARGATEKVAPTDDIILDFDSAGRVLARDTKGKPVRITVDPEGQLGKLLGQLSKIDPEVDTFEGLTAFEQIKAMRSDFFDLKNSAVPGQERIDNRIAGLVYDALSEAMDNPIGEGSERAVELYRAASTANRHKEQILEIVDIRKIAQTSDLTPDQLMREIARPGKGSTLRVLATILPPEQFQQFRQSFLSDLVSEPEKIVGRLDAFRRDPRALRTLMSPEEQSTLRALGNRWQQFQSSKIKKTFQTVTDGQQRAIRMVRKADAGSIEAFVQRGGGKTSPIGRVTRAGAFQDLLDSATKTDKGVQVLNPEALISGIKKLEANGKLHAIFTPEDVDFLLSRRDLASMLEISPDSGAALQAAEIAAKLGGVLEAPVNAKAIPRFLSGISNVSRNAILGRLFTNPKTRTFFSGTGGKPLDFTTLRAMSAISAQMLADAQEDLKAFQE